MTLLNVTLSSPIGLQISWFHLPLQNVLSLARNRTCQLSSLLLWRGTILKRLLSLSFVPQTIEELEKEMLNGQKLQGPQTSAEVYRILKQKGLLDK